MSDLFRLDGRVAAVIGAGSGIGEAVASGMAEHGAHVVCLDIAAGPVERLTARIVAAQGRADCATLDVRDAAAVSAMLDGVWARTGSLDIVVATPSINVRKPLLDYEVEEFDRVVELNLKGTFNVLRAAGRIMARQRRGSIILYSSIRSQVVEPGQGVYAATKAGILQLARAAAAELGPAGVRVNAIGPGVVETPLTAPIKANPAWYHAYASKNALGRWARADELVGPTIFLASDASSYVTGTLLLVDGGWTAIDGRFTPPGMRA